MMIIIVIVAIEKPDVIQIIIVIEVFQHLHHHHHRRRQGHIIQIGAVEAIVLHLDRLKELITVQIIAHGLAIHHTIVNLLIQIILNFMRHQ